MSILFYCLVSSDIKTEKDIIHSVADFDNKIHFTLDQIFNTTQLLSSYTNENVEVLEKLSKATDILAAEALPKDIKEKLLYSIDKNKKITDKQISNIVNGNLTESERIIHFDNSENTLIKVKINNKNVNIDRDLKISSDGDKISGEVLKEKIKSLKADELFGDNDYDGIREYQNGKS